MKKAYFISGKRTPFARAHKGAYVEVRPDELLVHLLDAQKKENSKLFDKGFSDLLVGCAYPEGEQGYNVARMVALGAGLDLPGATVNRLCASSLEVVAMAASRIKLNWSDSVIVAGLESMTRVKRLGESFSESELIKENSPNAYITMGLTAENVCKKYPNITRSEQEDFAIESHRKASEAYQEGKYAKQIFNYLIERDEFVRYPADVDKIRSLKSAFVEDGTVTAATSSPLTDGATSGFVVSEDVIIDLAYKSGLEIIDAQVSHVLPELMGIGPIPATSKILERNSLQVKDIAAFEINEAFAIQVVATINELAIEPSKVNAWGGALALGHPLGASGLRLIMTLAARLEELDIDGAYGIATLCVGGGQGMSVLCKHRKF